MIKTKGSYGKEVKILATFPNWQSDGKSYSRVVVEIIEECKLQGKREVLLDMNLTESRKGEIEKAKQRAPHWKSMFQDLKNSNDQD